MSKVATVNSAELQPIYQMIDKLRNRMRGCQQFFRTLTPDVNRRVVDVCAAELSRIESACPKLDELQVELMFLRRDFQCLLARVKVAESKLPKPTVPLAAKPVSATLLSPASIPVGPLRFKGEGWCRLQIDFPQYFGNMAGLQEILTRIGIAFQTGKAETGALYIDLPFNGLELRALVQEHPELSDFFYGSAYKTCFSRGAVSEAVTSRKGFVEVFPPGLRRVDFVKELVAEARTQLHQRKAEPVSCAISKAALESRSEPRMLGEIYDKFPGLCVGEWHSAKNSKRFIIENMKALKAMGVTTLFLEHVMYDTMQPVLDAWFKKAPDAPMPTILKAYLRDLDLGQHTTPPYGFTDLVLAAKANNIRIVGIDTTVAYDAGYNGSMAGDTGDDRILAMNHVAEKIMRHEMGQGKYIALMGRMHGSRNPALKEKAVQKAPPGIAELMQCPYALVSDSDKDTNIQTNVFTDFNARIHLYIKNPVAAAASPFGFVHAPSTQTLVYAAPLRFEGSGCTLAVMPKNEQAGAVQQFLDVIQKNGLQNQIAFDMGKSPEGCTEIRFRHSGRELDSLRGKYPELSDFFHHSGESCFVRGTTPGSFSGKGFVEQSPGDGRKKEIMALVAEADKRFLKVNSDKVKCKISPESLQSDEALLREVYGQNFQGLCIGEGHGLQNPKRFILDNLPTLKALGVKTLFMEFLTYDNMQPVLDAYMRMPRGSPMPAILETFLAWHDRGHKTTPPYTYTNLVRAAHDAGIRIVGLDTTVATDAGYEAVGGNSGPTRIKAFNYVAEKIIRNECGKDRYIALMGSAHGGVNVGHEKLLWDAIPGVATLLECPFFVIEDSADATSDVRTDVQHLRSDHCFINLYMKKPVPGSVSGAVSASPAQDHKKPAAPARKLQRLKAPEWSPLNGIRFSIGLTVAKLLENTIKTPLPLVDVRGDAVFFTFQGNQDASKVLCDALTAEEGFNPSNMHLDKDKLTFKIEDGLLFLGKTCKFTARNLWDLLRVCYIDHAKDGQLSDDDYTRAAMTLKSLCDNWQVEGAEELLTAIFDWKQGMEAVRQEAAVRKNSPGTGLTQLFAPVIIPALAPAKVAGVPPVPPKSGATGREFRMALEEAQGNARALKSTGIPNNGAVILSQMIQAFKGMEVPALQKLVQQVQEKLEELDKFYGSQLFTGAAGQDSNNRRLLTDVEWSRRLRDPQVLIGLFAQRELMSRSSKKGNLTQLCERIFHGFRDNHPALLEVLPVNESLSVGPRKEHTHLLEYNRRKNIEMTFLPILQGLEGARQALQLPPKVAPRCNLDASYDPRRWKDYAPVISAIAAHCDGTDAAILLQNAAKETPEGLANQCGNGFAALLSKASNGRLVQDMTINEAIEAIARSHHLADPDISHMLDPLHLLAGIKTTSAEITFKDGKCSYRTLLSAVVLRFLSQWKDEYLLASEQFFARFMAIADKCKIPPAGASATVEKASSAASVLAKPTVTVPVSNPIGPVSIASQPSASALAAVKTSMATSPLLAQPTSVIPAQTQPPLARILRDIKGPEFHPDGGIRRSIGLTVLDLLGHLDKGHADGPYVDLLPGGLELDFDKAKLPPAYCDQLHAGLCSAEEWTAKEIQRAGNKLTIAFPGCLVFVAKHCKFEAVHIWQLLNAAYLEHAPEGSFTQQQLDIAVEAMKVLCAQNVIEREDELLREADFISWETAVENTKREAAEKPKLAAPAPVPPAQSQQYADQARAYAKQLLSTRAIQSGAVTTQGATLVQELLAALEGLSVAELETLCGETDEQISILNRHQSLKSLKDYQEDLVPEFNEVEAQFAKTLLYRLEFLKGLFYATFGGSLSLCGGDSMNRELLTDARWVEILRKPEIMLGIFAHKALMKKKGEQDDSNRMLTQLADMLFYGLKDQHPAILETLPLNRKFALAKKGSVDHLREYMRRKDISTTFGPILQTLMQLHQAYAKKPLAKAAPQRLDQPYEPKKWAEYIKLLEGPVMAAIERTRPEVLLANQSGYIPSYLQKEFVQGFEALVKLLGKNPAEMTLDEVVESIAGSHEILDQWISHAFYDPLHLQTALKCTAPCITLKGGQQISPRELMLAIFRRFAGPWKQDYCLAAEQFYVRLMMIARKLGV